MGWAVYEVERYIKGTDKKIEDGSHLIFVNASVIEDSPIGRLMADMREADPKKMNYQIVAEKVDQIKNGKGGYENMCAFSERMIAYGEARGRAEGEARGRAAGRAEGEARGRAEGEARGIAFGRSGVAQGMLRDKLPLEMVTKYTGLSEQELRKMQAEMK